VSLARRGILVLAIDPVGQGERIEHLYPSTHKPLLRQGGTAEHMADGLAALLTGTNLARYMIWDGIRGIDYLLSRNDVDRDRIGVAGNSGGGTQSAYISALDKRVFTSVISCYLSSWDAAWENPGPQDSEQVFDDFLSDGLDFADFLISIAPRPAEMEVATRDFFPIAGAHQTFAEAQRIYGFLGQKDHIAIFEANDNHGWSKPRRIAAYTWLSKWLKGSPGPSEEAPVETDSPIALRATPTGQVLTSYRGAETVQSINATLAKRLRSKPFQGTAAQLAKRVRARLGLPSVIDAPTVEDAGKFSTGELNGEKLNFHTEPGITVPGLLFIPKNPSPGPAIVYLDPSGMMDAGSGGAIQHLVDKGNVVLAVDPRGWGQNRPPNRMISGYPSDYQLAMHAFMVGKSMPGMQTLDVLSVVRYLATTPEVGRRSVAVHALGSACNIGLFAAILEPRIKQVTCDQKPISYLAMTQLPLADVSPEEIVPGILRDFDTTDIMRALGSRVRIQR
jgi:cephalosporin-C deacetylase-like acetyl esterase